MARFIKPHMKTHPQTIMPPPEDGQALEQKKHAVQPLPRYLRLPRNGSRCPHTGLSRSALNSLILGHRPPVKSVSLRSRYSTRGARLICGESLDAYLRSLDSNLNGEDSSNNAQEEA